METRQIPNSRIRLVVLALGVLSAGLVAAQEASPLNPAPNLPGVTAPVQLPNGATDILKLSRAKVSDDVTVAFIQNRDHGYKLTANEILFLRQEGVSDRVLATMLNQPPVPSAESSVQPQSTEPAVAPIGSAPQFVESYAPTSTAIMETAPAATVYLATTPTYYSFYDPWPAWSWSCWYPWPWFTFSFAWGSCGYGYWNYGYCYNGAWNNGNCYNGYGNNYYGHAGNYASPANVNRPPPPNGNPPAGRGAVARSQPGNLAAGANQIPSGNLASRTENRKASAAQNGGSTSYWNGNGGQTAAARPTARPAEVGATRNSQAARSPGTWSGDRNHPNSQTVASRPSLTQNSAPGFRSNPNRASANSATVSRSPGNFEVSSIRSGSPSAYRPVAAPSANYGRSGLSPSYNSRSVGSAASFSRPSSPASFGGMAGPGAVRGGGGGFSGGSGGGGRHR